MDEYSPLKPANLSPAASSEFNKLLRKRNTVMLYVGPIVSFVDQFDQENQPIQELEVREDYLHTYQTQFEEAHMGLLDIVDAVEIDDGSRRLMRDFTTEILRTLAKIKALKKFNAFNTEIPTWEPLHNSLEQRAYTLEAIEESSPTTQRSPSNREHDPITNKKSASSSHTVCQLIPNDALNNQSQRLFEPEHLTNTPLLIPEEPNCEEWFQKPTQRPPSDPWEQSFDTVHQLAPNQVIRALAWFRSDFYLMNIFVANQVATIQELSRTRVHGHQIPSDYLSAPFNAIRCS